MPPFFNRLQSLIPKIGYPYPTPAFNSQGLTSDSPSRDYINQDVMGVDNRLNQLGMEEPDLITEQEQSVNKRLKPYETEFQTLADRLKSVTADTPSMDTYQQFLAGGMPNPQDYKPGKLDRLTAALAGFSSGAQEGPTKGVILARDILQQPYERAMDLYGKRGKQLEQGALAEEKKIYNERQSLDQLMNRMNQQKDIARKEAADEAREKSRQRANEIRQQLANDKNLKLLEEPGGTYKVVNITTGQTKDTGITSRHLTDEDNLSLKSQYALDLTAAKGIQQRKNIEAQTEAYKQTQGWETWNIPDPDDPSKQVTVRMNRTTNQVEFFNKDGQKIGPVSKGGTKGGQSDITAQTRAMMEGAKMLLTGHHVEDLRDQAAQLNQRGLFGPIMSRVRDLAAKYGTVEIGKDFDRDQQDLIDLGDQISRINPDPGFAVDPATKRTNDYLVGEFLVNLGLMTPGMGRVHGGARGGGSIEMVKYLKTLLTSSSSVGMFLGRLETVHDYLSGYAKGPKPPKDKLDNLIERAFPELVK